MSKPRKLGKQCPFVPNAVADRKYNRKLYDRGRQFAESQLSRAYQREAKHHERQKQQEE